MKRLFVGAEVDAVDELDRLLEQAVQCRLRSDVPLGALLSGGIDSSTVVALMQAASTRPVKTFTIGFGEEAFDESRHAARVASHLRTDHTELPLTGDDARKMVPHLPEIFGEPFADPSQLPTLLVSELARRQVTVAPCGDGGDELFGGYNRCVYGTRVLPRVDRIPFAARRFLGAGISRMPAATWQRASQAAAALLPGVSDQRLGEQIHKLGNLMRAGSTGEMYRSLLAAWQHPERLVTGTAASGDQNGVILNAHEPGHLLDRMMLADQMTYLPDDLLAKVDRASMAVSLELRAPILDHRVVEFSWRLPGALKIRGALGKWILRQPHSDVVPIASRVAREVRYEHG